METVSRSVRLARSLGVGTVKAAKLLCTGLDAALHVYRGTTTNLGLDVRCFDSSDISPY
jgi:hypothetical protein